MENTGLERSAWTDSTFVNLIVFQGAGRARVEPHPGFVVDFFVTHTCAVGPTYTNAYYREHQVWKLNVTWASVYFDSRLRSLLGGWIIPMLTL